LALNRFQSVIKPRPVEYQRWWHQQSIARGVYLLLKKASRRGASFLHGKMTGYLRIVDFLQSLVETQLASEIQRVSSGRSAPHRWYPRTGLTSVGAFTRLFDRVDPTLVDPSPPGYERYRRWRVGRRMHSISVSPIFRRLAIASAIKNKHLSAYHTAVMVRDSVTHIDSNLTDVGYGASQVFPVIRAAADASIGPLFVEQPEIHLHPRAQGHIANLLIDASKHRQVIVETHSEHMVNSARIQLARGTLSAGDVAILYVDRSQKGSKVQMMGVNQRGDLTTDWPEGFFEERYRDTLTLVGLKSRANRSKDS
jgi:hypothetical protein